MAGRRFGTAIWPVLRVCQLRSCSMTKIRGTTKRIVGVPQFTTWSSVLAPIFKIPPRLKAFARKVKSCPIAHIQGIARTGPYIILSSSFYPHEIIVVDSSNENPEYKKSYSLPDCYEHAGGIDVLETAEEDTWCIAVPVWKKTGSGGAVLLYSLKCGCEGQPCLTHRASIRIDEKAYAAGIDKIGERIVLAVVCDADGKKVRFFKSNTTDPFGGYTQLGNVWCESRANKDNWYPDQEWAGYPNNVSLVSYQNCLYLIGLKGIGKWRRLSSLIGLYKKTKDTLRANIG